ncbi:uncharacterized protein MONOS_17158 [Monocercomonoides exilis]|uniref:uncharacterized protein n=1 Tax=Monocercomonoides exilis TaxID=2049356 RepID=UPI0035594B3C|nr:hypothetical protein MONOS_17158 [Monocercomonoides exilis]
MDVVERGCLISKRDCLWGAGFSLWLIREADAHKGKWCLQQLWGDKSELDDVFWELMGGDVWGCSHAHLGSRGSTGKGMCDCFVSLSGRRRRQVW